MASEVDSPVEFFYDLESQKAVLLGNTALLGALSSFSGDYVEELARRKRLMIVSVPYDNVSILPDLYEGIRTETEVSPEIYSLGHLLTDTSVEIQPVERRLFRGISKESSLLFGHWVHEQASIHNRDAVLDLNLVERAHALGVGPSVKMLTYRFVNMTQYYIELEKPRSLRKYQFDNWPDQRFTKYLASIGQVPNSPPRMGYINQLAKENVRNPAFSFLIKRFGGGNNALELAGYWIIPNWDNDDYIEWGVQFARANAGQIPSRLQIYELSAKGLGPSPSNIAKTRFGRISLFQEEVKKALGRYSSNHRLLRAALVRSYLEMPELFRGSGRRVIESDLGLYARYTLLSKLQYANLPYEKRIELCRSTEHLDFIPTIANLNRSISIQEIKKEARTLGIYSYVSSASHYRNLLRLPETQRDTDLPVNYLDTNEDLISATG